MRKKQINKGNRLIAEFMGGIYSEYANAWGFGNAKIHKEHITVEGKTYKNLVWAQRFEKELKYHSSLEWIFTVVEKIEKLGFYSQINGCASSICHYCWFDEGGDGGDLPSDRVILGYNSLRNESRVHTIWKAVIEFIKWYNKNKKY